MGRYKSNVKGPLIGVTLSTYQKTFHLDGKINGEFYEICSSEIQQTNLVTWKETKSKIYKVNTTLELDKTNTK